MEFFEASIQQPVSFISCGHFIHEDEWAHIKRVIDSFELIIGVEGTAYIQQEEEKFVVTPGKVLLLFPGRTHQGYAKSAGRTAFYWLHFTLKGLHRIIEQKEALPLAAGCLPGFHVSALRDSILIPSFFTLTNKEKIFILFHQLLHTYRSDYYTSSAPDYLLTALLIEITQQAIGSISHSMGADAHNDKRFTSILEWIRINIQQDITVHDIALRFGFNDDYLSRLFKRNAGISPIKYIHHIRLQMAKELLCQPEKNIKEIAYQVGFKDEKYFMKLFRQNEGITPTEFRNAYYLTHLNNR